MRCLLIFALLLVTLAAVHGASVSKTQLYKRLLQKKGSNHAKINHMLQLKNLKRKTAAKREYGDDCDWYCDYNEADESYKCLHEADFCDGAPVCTVGTDEDYCDASKKRNLKLKLKNLMKKATAKRQDSDDDCDWYCDYNEADESYKCLHEADFCDGTPVCTDGTDEDYFDESYEKRNLKLKLKNLLKKGTAKRQDSDDDCDWYCDYNEADESYKCLHEADFCDGAPVCTDGIDEDYCDESYEKRNLKLKLKNLLKKGTAKRQDSDDDCDWYCDYNEADESYKCLHEADFCDGTPVCTDGTDGTYCDESHEKRNLKLQLKNLLKKGAAKRKDSGNKGTPEGKSKNSKKKPISKREDADDCDWICDVNEEDETYKCLKEGDFCDDTQTCDDGTDEDYCEACANAVDWCDEQEDGSAQCLTENQLCDGTPNCNNGYDESNFVCCDDVCDVQADYSSTCLDYDDYCDDVADCYDGYDEDPYWCLAAAKKLNVSSKKGASKRTSVQRLLSKLLVKKKK